MTYAIMHLSLLAPGVVQVVGIDQSTVTWRLPIQPNGIITNYQVIVFDYDNRENVVIDSRLDASQLSYSIPGLGKQHCINIRCLCGCRTVQTIDRKQILVLLKTKI